MSGPFSDIGAYEFNLGLSVHEKFDSESSVLVYPVPTSDLLNIEIEHSLTEQAELIIYDLLGKEVKRKILTQNKTSLSLKHDLQSGLYFYDLRMGSEKLRAGKIIID